MFGESEFSFPETSDTRPYEEEGAVLDAFKRLTNIDPSFRSHLENRKVDLARIGQMTKRSGPKKSAS